MAKRNSDALAIGVVGACNPSGIAHSIIDACKEMRAEPGFTGTNALCADPAIRMMVYQLAYLCKVSELQSPTEFSKMLDAVSDGIRVR